MPESNELTPLQSAWLVFVDSLQILFVPQMNDTSLYQYLQLRDNVMAMIRKQIFLDGLDAAWRPTIPGTDTSATVAEVAEVQNLLVLELQAFVQGLRHDPAPKNENHGDKKQWGRKWLGRAASVAGSMKELPEKLKLPWYVESGLIAFKELVEAFEHN